MAYANGRVPSTVLRKIDGTPLLSSTANALKVLVLLSAVHGIDVEPAEGLGSGYRDLAMQQLFWRASRGDTAAMHAVGLSSKSTVPVAVPGSSSHGFGNRVDLVFNRSDSPTTTQLGLANHCGFTREFQGDDPNHFEHDGRSAISGPNAADWHRIVAFYLNGQKLGETTTTVDDGIVDRSKPQHYTWLVQAHGMKRGSYRVPPYKHDGIPGPHTDAEEQWIRNMLWAGVQ